LTGRWLVDGSPQVILFDIGSAAWKLDQYKQTLWDTCNIGIPHLDIEANDAVILGYLISEFLSEVSIYIRGVIQEVRGRGLLKTFYFNC